MNAILSQFSITVLIRQFFCGVVFFLPAMLAGSGDAQLSQLLLKSESSFAIGLFVALACIIGTIIHHIEKNSYSYVLQGFFCYIKDNESAKSRSYNIIGGFTILLVLISIICGLIDAWFWLAVVVISFFVVLNLSCFLDKLLTINQKIWIISETSKIHRDDDYLRLNLSAKNAILKRLDAWADNIHCVQSCCFAWLLGLCFARYLVTQGEYTMIIFAKMSATSIEYSTVFDSGLAEAQLQSFSGWSTVLAFLLLFWEACFEWHRFQHIFHIVGSMEISFKKQNRQ